MQLTIDIIYHELSQLYNCTRYGNDSGVLLSHPSMLTPQQTLIHDEVVYVCDIATLPKTRSNGFFVCSGEPCFAAENPEICAIFVTDAAAETLFDALLEIFKKYNRWDNSLRSALSLDEPLKAMATCSEAIFKNPLCVVDTDFRLIVPLCENPEKYSEIKLTPPDEDGFIQFEHVNYYKNDPKHAALNHRTDVFTYKSNLLPYGCFGINFFRGNEFIARILIFEAHRDYRSIDQFLLKHLAQYMQPCFSLTVAHIFPDSKGFHNYLLALLEGEKMKPLIESSLSPRNWTATDSFLWIHLLQSEKDLTNKTTNYTCIKIEKHFSQSCAVKWAGGISILINLSAAKQTEPAFITKFAAFAAENSYQAGLSNSFSGTKKLTDFHTQATIAAMTGKSVDPEKTIFKFTEYAVTHFLKHGIKPDTSIAFCHPAVQILAGYDADNDSDYLKTLKIYLENQMGILATAHDLDIHRSTMIYRLKRINALTEIDWNDKETLFYIAFSLKMVSEGFVVL